MALIFLIPAKPLYAIAGAVTLSAVAGLAVWKELHGIRVAMEPSAPVAKD